MALQFWNLRTVLTIFFLVIGHMPSRVEPIEPVSIAAIASAAGSMISAGSSLTGTTLHGMASTDYRVSCAIQVENWTNYPLIYAQASLTEGAITTNPSSILPGKKEAFAVRKAAHSAYGTWGTVSWEVVGAQRRFVLMWSAPYSFNRYVNEMGVGMTRTNITSVPEGNRWYDQMYNHFNNDDLKFEKRKYYYTTAPVIYRDDDFEIVGLMNNIHTVQIKVVFRPVQSKWHTHLADSIKIVLGLNNHPTSN